MKWLKRLVLVVLAMVLAILAIAIFLPETTLVKATKNVDTPVANVFSLVNDIRSWNQWAYWNKVDPQWKQHFSDQSVGQGAYYSWNSQNPDIDSGKLTLSEVIPNELVGITLEFRKWGRSESKIRFAPAGEGAQITWEMPLNSNGNPFQKLMNIIFMKSMLLKQFNASLDALAKVAEATPPLVGMIPMTQENIMGDQYVMLRQKINMAAVPAFLQNAFGKLISENQGSQAEAFGLPTAIYFSWDENRKKADMAAGLTKGPIQDWGKLITKAKTAAGNLNVYEKRLVLDYFGGYEGLGTAHAALDQWVKENGKTHVFPILEEYVTDPMLEKDTSKWWTRVVYFYK